MNLFLFSKKKLLNIFMFLVMFFTYYGIGSAATIYSTSEGGSWGSTSTWEGGVIPGVNDDVIIDSQVIYPSYTSEITINSLTINEGGELKMDYYSATNGGIINVKNKFINKGSIHGKTYRNYKLEFNFYGDIENYGEIIYVWSNIYSNLFTSIDSNWTGFTKLIGEKNRTLNVEGNMGTLSLSNDISLIGDNYINAKIYGDRNKLIIDSSNDIFILETYLITIEDINLNNTDELINVGTAKNTEFIVENVNINNIDSNITGKNIYLEGTIKGDNLNIEKLYIKGQVLIDGTTIIDGNLYVENSGILNKTDRYNYYDFTVNGNIINNGRILGASSSYANRLNYYFNGNIENNGTIYSNSIIHIYGLIDSKDGSSWKGKINYYGNEIFFNENDNFTPSIYLTEDFNITKDLNFNGLLYLGGNNLYIDGTKNIYIYKIYGSGKILSFNTDGDGEKLTIGSITSIEEINIENIYVNSFIENTNGRNIYVKKSFNGDIKADKLIVNGDLKIYGTTNIEGNLFINEGFKIYNDTSSSSIRLTINGALYNKGTIGGTGGRYDKYINLYMNGDLLNEGTIVIRFFYLNGSIYNLDGLFDGYPFLKWDRIDGYNSYILNTNLEGDIAVNGDYYRIDSDLINNGNLIWKIKGDGLIIDSDWSENKYINNEGIIDISFPLEIDEIPNPINLNQYLEAPLMEREILDIGKTVGKYQSGSGVIFETFMDTDNSYEYRVNIDLYNSTTGENIIYNTDYKIGNGYRNFYVSLGKGDYSWKVQFETIDGIKSEWVSFGDNGDNKDFSIFEGFEPYPYGFSFVNNSPISGLLTGGFKKSLIYGQDKLNIEKINGTKWNIFYKAFDIEGLIKYNNYGEIIDDRKVFYIYESLGLNNDVTFFDKGSCFGLSTLALLKYKDDYFKSRNIESYLEKNHNKLYTKLKKGSVYDLISSPSSDLTKNWDIYSDELEDIFSLHLFQYNVINYALNDEGIPTDNNGNFIFNPNKVLEILKNNPDKKYILNFEWKENGQKLGHTVIPYRVDGNRIYIWDNVSPYGEIYDAYNEYIDVKDNGKIYISSKSNVNEDDFTLIGLMDIEEMNNNGNKSKPIGFNLYDTLYTLNGKSDILLSDINGNKTGYKNGKIYEEIPGSRIIVNYSGKTIENTWKQIYLPKKLEDITIEINSKTDENYDLMIAGGDYYTKLEGVSTSSGQTDKFNILRENIEIDFDDNKLGTYNILVDDFKDNGTGAIYINNLGVISDKQEFNINWEGEG